MTEPGTTYPLTAAQIREKRRQRAIQAATSELARLSYERQEIHDEYQRVSGIYARQLERIKKKAENNGIAMKALRDKTNVTLAEFDGHTP